MTRPPIDYCRFEPVPGKPGAFRAINKETGEAFDIAKTIEGAFNAGKCSGKMKI